MCQTCCRKHSWCRRGERDEVICISNRCIGTRLMNRGDRSAHVYRGLHGEKMHQTESFLAVFVDINRQSLQKHDTSPILQLG